MFKSTSQAWTLALLLSTTFSAMGGEIPDLNQTGDQTTSSRPQTRLTTKRRASNPPELTDPKRQRTEKEQTVTTPESPQGGEITVEILENSWNLPINKTPIFFKEMYSLFTKASKDKDKSARNEFIARCNHNFINKSFRENRTDSWFNLIDVTDVTKLNYDEFLFLFDILSYKIYLLTNEKLLEAFIHLIQTEKSTAEGSVEQAKYQFLLGTCSEFGLGTTQDQQKAIAYYKSAADLGLKRAMVYLWWFYGEPTKKDTNPAEAEKYKQLSLANNSADAILLYGVISAQYQTRQLANQPPAFQIDLTTPAETSQATRPQPRTTIVSPTPQANQVTSVPAPVLQNNDLNNLINQQRQLQPFGQSPIHQQIVMQQQIYQAQQTQQPMPAMQQTLACVSHPMHSYDNLRPQTQPTIVSTPGHLHPMVNLQQQAQQPMAMMQPANIFQVPLSASQAPTMTTTQQDTTVRATAAPLGRGQIRNMELPEILKVFENQFNNMKFLHETCSAKVNSQQDAFSQLQAQNVALEEQLKKLNNLLEEEKRKSKTLQDELEEKDLLCSVAITESDNYKTERDSLSDSLKREQSKSERLQEKYDQEILLNTQLSKKMNEQKTQLEKTARIEKNHKELQETYEGQQEKFKELHENYKLVHKKNKDKRLENIKIKEDLVTLREELKTKEERLKTLEAIEKVSSEQKTLIDSLKEDLKEKEDKLKTLEAIEQLIIKK